MMWRHGFDARGDDSPVDTLVYTWLFVVTIPVATIAWATTGQTATVFGATFATFLLPIFQGATKILHYRNTYADAPLPQTPSHGVVVVDRDDRDEQEEDSREQTGHANGKHDSRVGCLQSNPPTHDSAQSQQHISSFPTVSQQCNGCECTAAHVLRGNHTEDLLKSTLQKKPLRLLVIGDSLAIGVGQSASATPVLPQAIAKTLSKSLDGRPVYWTCHGQAGASTGWLVREIERGTSIPPRKDRVYTMCPSDDEDDANSLAGSVAYSSNTSDTDTISERSFQDKPVWTECGYVSSDSSDDGLEQCKKSGSTLSLWKERLYQHGERLGHQDRLGPYDIVVVLTGSNDLKSTFFPFLLTGEDVEFRRQARDRGGCYTKELRRLFDTLNKRMQRRMQKFRSRVEIATETFRERVGDTFDFISVGTNAPRNMQSKSTEGDIPSIHVTESTDSCDSFTNKCTKHPLVVLPGMPARSLPVFRTLPLRWLAVPVVDIMDMHKRNFAAAHPDDVLFVPSPSMRDLHNYEQTSGEIWKQRTRENTLLELEDIRGRDRRKIEAKMHSYYLEKTPKCATKPNLLSRFTGQRGNMVRMFSPDQIHPQDDGYDFWGRYIGNSIAAELQKRDQSFT